MTSISRFSTMQTTLQSVWFAMMIMATMTFRSDVHLSGQDPYQLPHIMWQDPHFEEVQPEVVFGNDLLPLWMKALNSESTELQRKAAETIPVAIHRGMSGLDKVTKPLLEKLNSPNLAPVVQLAIVKAVVAIGDLKSAERLAKLHSSTSDSRVQKVIENALIDWKNPALKSIWRKRILDATTGNTNGILSDVLAIRGVTSIGDDQSIASLGILLADREQNFRVRYEAAKSIGQLASSGFIEFSRSRLSSDQLTERILGVTVMDNHPSASSHPILLSYAIDPEPAVAVIAWESILGSNAPRELDQSIEFAMTNPDNKIRILGLNLIRLWKNRAAVQRAGQLLSDPHPAVRNLARQICLEFASADDPANPGKPPALMSDVLAAGMKSLQTNWQGIQQGLLLLSELDHKPAAERCLELLDHPRPEVHITAGWTLDRLSVKSTFPTILQRLEKQVSDIKSGGAAKYPESQYESIAHLIELLGRNKYADLQTVVIEKLIAKDMSILSYPIRPAAIWSIGQIFKGKKIPEGLSDRMLERLMDDDNMNPEHENVKSMVAIAFALTGDQSKVDSIRTYAESSKQNARLGFSCYWSINQLTGEPIPIPKKFERKDTNWFLVPIQ